MTWKGFWKKDEKMLFGKWKVKKFKDHHADNKGNRKSCYSPEQIFSSYKFDFGEVFVSIDPIQACYVNGKGNPLSNKDNYDIDILFEPRMAEIYGDAKESVKKFIEFLSLQEPSLKRINVDKISYFRRGTHFKISLDLDKYSIDDIDAKNNARHEIYSGLEEGLINDFGAEKFVTGPHVELGFLPAGEGKVVKFSDHNWLYAYRHDDSLSGKIASSMNSQYLYFYLGSDEMGDKEVHDAVFKFCKNYIDSNHIDKLSIHEGSGIYTSLIGNGCEWNINLDQITALKRLENESIIKLLE